MAFSRPTVLSIKLKSELKNNLNPSCYGDEHHRKLYGNEEVKWAGFLKNYRQQKEDKDYQQGDDNKKNGVEKLETKCLWIVFTLTTEMQ